MLENTQPGQLFVHKEMTEVAGHHGPVGLCTCIIPGGPSRGGLEVEASSILVFHFCKHA